MSYNEIENERSKIMNFMFIAFGLFMIFTSILMEYIEEIDIAYAGLFFIIGGFANILLIELRG